MRVPGWDGKPPAFAVVVESEGGEIVHGFQDQGEAEEVAAMLHDGHEGAARVTVWRRHQDLPPDGGQGD